MRNNQNKIWIDFLSSLFEEVCHVEKREWISPFINDKINNGTYLSINPSERNTLSPNIRLFVRDTEPDEICCISFSGRAFSDFLIEGWFKEGFNSHHVGFLQSYGYAERIPIITNLKFNYENLLAIIQFLKIPVNLGWKEYWHLTNKDSPFKVKVNINGTKINFEQNLVSEFQEQIYLKKDSFYIKLSVYFKELFHKTDIKYIEISPLSRNFDIEERAYKLFDVYNIL